MIKGYYQASIGLEEEILQEISILQKKKLLRGQIGYSLVSVVSLVGIIFSTIYVVQVIMTSGAYEYISLLFSDINTLSYWKEISLSFAESFPFLGFAISLAILGLFLWSLLKNLKIQEFKGQLIKI